MDLDKCSSCVSMHNSLKNWLKNLKIYERTIEVLFEVSPPPTQLEEKLLALQELISNTPTEFGELVFDEVKW